MNNDKLNILWTNADPVAAELMLMMYSTYAMKRNWWKEVRIIIWGSTAKLAAEDVHIQKLIAEAQEAGVEFSACEACANHLGVKETIRNLGIEIKFWGEPLTEIIKSKEHLITV
ncbi:DsrE family protein [Maridesulfovibrio frigidus]|uniref:DsrE family protein n=1 Tax=Maridesulfovibrio frigidus TaxID=340956 RepID=UPI0004E1CE0A|nr:DsrE family protein [Maridesulfovibrio frigidus]